MNPIRNDTTSMLIRFSQIRTPADAAQFAFNELRRIWPQLPDFEKAKIVNSMHAFLREIEKEDCHD
jgi:hypothetical protein